jgi:hypothetical protein
LPDEPAVPRNRVSERNPVSTCVQYLHEQGRTPEQYVLDCFAARDVVLLAEDHAIRHNLLLVQRLIPLLPAAGVYTLGMEFGASEDQAALDALTTADAYDEAQARRLMFNYNVGWAYREYTDLYRAAWAYNRARPAGSRPFRVLNLSYRYDWRDAGPVRTPAGTRRVFAKGGTERYRAELIGREVLDRGDKLLVLTGGVHALTRCTVPEFDFNADGFVRYDDGYMGHRLHRAAPGRVACVWLHRPLDSRLNGPAERVHPASGALERILSRLTNRRAGFDLLTADGHLTPLGALAEDSYYATGRPGFRLADLADGYIYEMPFRGMRGCTVDEAFLTDDNWPEARAQWPDPHWRPRPNSPSDYWREVRAYVDIGRRYAQVIASEAALAD